MKQFILTLFLSTLFLSACQADKVPETANVETKTTDEVTAEVAATTEASVEAGDGEETGESIHEANCVRCHGSEVYTRADRRVTSLEALGAQVRMCDSQLKTGLFPEDMEKITDYLNETYYKF